MKEITSKIFKFSSEFGINSFLVGGTVRDLMLKRHTSDLDFLLEGDVYPIALKLKEEIGGNLTLTFLKKFGTASLKSELEGWEINLARAREEKYPFPGAIPEITFIDSALEDLKRRDFTVNAMALELREDGFGKLLDPFEGLRDLEKNSLEVIHKESISDDPTRIIRAVRISKRLGFSIGRSVLESLEIALKKNAFSNVQGDRFMGELKLLDKEPCPIEILKTLDELNVLEAIHPILKLDEKKREKIAGIKAEDESKEGMGIPKFFFLYSKLLNKDEIKVVLDRLKVGAQMRKKLGV